MTDPRHGARSALIILFAINLLNFFDRNMFGAVAEPIRKEWALNDSQIGWLATAFILLYAFVGVPLGRLSDRRNRPQILGIGVAVWSLLTAASGMAWSYATLFAARVGVGIGEASCAPHRVHSSATFILPKRGPGRFRISCWDFRSAPFLEIW